MSRNRGRSRKQRAWWMRSTGGAPHWLVMSLLGFVSLSVGVAAITALNRLPPSVQLGSIQVEASPDVDRLERPRAAFVGDSWIEGTQVDEDQRFVSLVADHFGWQLSNFGEGGTGYVTGGTLNFPDRTPVSERMTAVASVEPEVVIVAAGINDAGRGYTDQQLRDAVERTFDEIRSRMPGAITYAIGPFWQNGYPTDDALRVDSIVREAATERGIGFVSPMAERWITGTNDERELGNRAEFISQAHPTAAGHLHLAAQVIAALETMGASPVPA